MIYDEFSPSRTRRTLTAGGRTLARLGLDGPLTGVLAIIVVIGILVVYSASGQNLENGAASFGEYRIAVAAMLALASSPPRNTCACLRRSPMYSACCC